MMTNAEKIEAWDKVEREENGLVDIKFYPGDISQSNIDSFCKSVLNTLEAEEQNKYTEITKL